MGIKGTVMPTLHRMALLSGASTWFAQRIPRRRILMVHNISLGSIEPAAFEAQLHWLRRRFRLISLPEMVSRIERGHPPEAPGELALTFDDGLRNHAENAYRILLQQRVPATFFICPDLIDQGRWLWNQEARERLRTLSEGQLHEVARAVGAPDVRGEQIVAWMKTLGLDARLRVEQMLRDASPRFEPDAGLRAIYDPLSWQQVVEMDQELITIGSHTLDHPILPTLDDAELERQMVQSRAALEQRLQRVVDLFCYPNGANDQRARALVARNYRAAVTSDAGTVPADVCRTLLPRVPAAATLSLLAWRLNRPGS